MARNGRLNPLLAALAMAATIEPRKCGTCRACCFTMGIVELNKPGFATCAHECERGCALYGKHDRPKECADFACLWLKNGPGLLDSDRPNLIGVMFTPQQTNLGPLLTAWEVVPGGFNNGRAHALIEGYAANMLVLLIDSSGTRRLIGPVMLLAHAERRMAELSGEVPLMQAIVAVEGHVMKDGKVMTLEAMKQMVAGSLGRCKLVRAPDGRIAVLATMAAPRGQAGDEPETQEPPEGQQGSTGDVPEVPGEG